MSSLAALATVTARCEQCGGPFTVGADRILAGGAKYCGKACRMEHRLDVVAVRNTPCGSCGEPRRTTRNSYLLQLCTSCQTIAWRSCWRKLPHDTDPGPRTCDDGQKVTTYSCELCGRWHETSIEAGAVMSDDYVARRVQLGTYLRARGFDPVIARRDRGVPQQRGEHD